MKSTDITLLSYGDPDFLRGIESSGYLENMDSVRSAFDLFPGTTNAYTGKPILLIAAMPVSAAAAWLDDFKALCSEIRRSVPQHYIILRHKEISAIALSRLFRNGLNDAVSMEEGLPGLEAAIESGRQSIARFLERLGFLKEQQTTAERLRSSQAELRKQVNSTSGELAIANQRLELANQQLTRHMSQLSLLYSFGRELSTARNWDKALEELLKNLADFVGARGAALVLRPAPDAPYTPRKTYQWRKPSWETILRNIDLNRSALNLNGRSESDIFAFETSAAGHSERITALPLTHRSGCLGYLLLLGLPGNKAGDDYSPLLNTLQVIIAEEVASAQMLDRMRELSVFNSRVLETVQSGIWVIDEYARTIYCNRVGREMMSGKPAKPRIIDGPRDGVGRGRGLDGTASMAEFFRREAFSEGPGHEIFLDGLLELSSTEGLPLRVLVDAGRTGWQGEGHLRDQDGSLLPVLIQSSEMNGRGRDETWLVVVLEDQREAKRLAAEKSRADKLQSMVEMSTTLAHEIRNPLMGLSAQAELLAENLPPEDSRGRYIDVIISEVERIDRTISGLLDFTRPCRPSLEPTDLRRILLDSVDLLAPKSKSSHVQIKVELAGMSDGHPFLDSAQIKQVILNLLSNAIDASRENDIVEVSVRTSAELSIANAESGLIHSRRGIMIEVCDSGQGFAEAGKEAIFRPFFTTKSAGTGLGLPVSRKIIEAHGGSLTAERRSGNTIFRIQLPEPVAASRNTQAKETT